MRKAYFSLFVGIKEKAKKMVSFKKKRHFVGFQEIIVSLKIFLTS